MCLIEVSLTEEEISLDWKLVWTTVRKKSAILADWGRDTCGEKEKVCVINKSVIYVK